MKSVGTLVLPVAVACAASPQAKDRPSSSTTGTQAFSPPVPVTLPLPEQACSQGGWPFYAAYMRRFLEGGRIVDRTARSRSTSEGQAYGLFFSLVANDADRFESILEWTRVHLFGGDFGKGPPAWLWGRANNGTWGVLDGNAATDADLWMAYSLLEAARLWNKPEYAALGRDLVGQVVEGSVRNLPGLGPMLLPGPQGFVLEEGTRWRLNPSYLVFAHLLRFESLGLPGDWSGLVASSTRLLKEASPAGYAPDWVIYDAEEGFTADTQAPPRSSYDAIRVPLFAAFLAPGDPLGRVFETGLAAPLDHFERTGRVEEQVHPQTLSPNHREGPPGFFAALIPAAIHSHRPDLADRLYARLQETKRGPLYGQPPAYYDQNLVMFGRGFAEGRFRFGPEGELRTLWSEPPCVP